MKITSKRRTSGLVAVAAASALFLAACGNGDGNGDDNGSEPGENGEAETGEDENGEDENGGAENGEGAGGTVTLGILPAWTDGLSMGYLWQEMLGDQGYDVVIEEINEAALLYTAVADGDYDVYPSAWPEVTHASYMEQYGDQLEDLGAYYEGAVLTFAVPEYSAITSIAELNDHADEFDNRVVGIEPGAGHMGVTADSVFPTYELDDNFDLVESSTTAMIAELGTAIDNEEEIVVTLWRPFWANAEYPVRDLEDPEGALGEPETLNFIANSEFSSEFPDVAEWMGNFTLDDDQYGELEDLIVNEYEGNEAEGARVWIENNQDIVDSIFNGS